MLIYYYEYGIKINMKAVPWYQGISINGGATVGDNDL